VRLFFLSDRIVLQRIKERDQRILGELYLRYEKMINNYILRNGGSNEDAQDMLQESIIVLWEKGKSKDFNLSSKLSTFLMAVVKNKWLSILRKNMRIDKSADTSNDFESDDDFSEKLEEDELSNRIKEAMGKLKEICRKLLLLYYYDERSMEDIAIELGLANPNVAKSKKYQCKKTLSAIIKKQIKTME